MTVATFDSCHIWQLPHFTDVTFGSNFCYDAVHTPKSALLIISNTKTKKKDQLISGFGGAIFFQDGGQKSLEFWLAFLKTRRESLHSDMKNTHIIYIYKKTLFWIKHNTCFRIWDLLEYNFTLQKITNWIASQTCILC